MTVVQNTGVQIWNHSLMQASVYCLLESFMEKVSPGLNFIGGETLAETC